MSAALDPIRNRRPQGDLALVVSLFAVILLIAWAISENRRIVAWRTLFAGIALQLLLAAALLAGVGMASAWAQPAGYPGIGREANELQWDLNYLLQLWEAIERSANEKPAPLLVFQESNVIIRALRDHLRADIDEILIDQESTFKLVKSFLQQVMPQFIHKAKLYQRRQINRMVCFCKLISNDTRHCIARRKDILGYKAGIANNHCNRHCFAQCTA